MVKTNGPHIEPAQNQEQGKDSFQFHENYRAVCDALNHRCITSSYKELIPESERLMLIEPIVERMRAGMLSRDQLLAFVSGVAHGGVPCADFINNPTMPLDLASLDGIQKGHWLPPHLTERRMEPELRKTELDEQQQHIVDAMQSALRGADSELPLFLLGSAALFKGGLPRDVDIGTSVGLRDQYMNDYKLVFENLIESIRDPFISGTRHVALVWPHFHLALGVSVSRYNRALRVTASDIYVIESSRKDR